MTALEQTDPAGRTDERQGRAPGAGSRSPIALVFTIPGLLAIIAAVAFPFALDDTNDLASIAASATVGVFGVLLTALTLVFALVVNVGSRWPSLGDLVRHAILPVWFALSIASVVLSVVAGAVKSSFLVVVSLGLALTGVLFGTWAIVRILAVSGHRRQEFLAGLLVRAIEREKTLVSSGEPSVDLEPYLGAVDAALDAAQVDTLRARLEELDEAVDHLSPEKLWLALDLLLRLTQRTGRAALLGQVGGEVSRSLLPLLVSSASRVSYRRVRQAPEDELRAAAYLGQLARTLAWLQSAADARFAEAGDKAPAMRRLMVTTLQARRALNLGMHPDPPRRPEERPLPAGLTDPRAAAIWLWGFVDLNGSDRGNGMYAFYAAVAGERFLGAYDAPGQSMLQELHEHVRADGRRSERRAARTSREFFSGAGGFRRCMLELAATALAVVRPLARATPAGLASERHFSQELRYAWIHTRLIGDQTATKVDVALDDLAHLLGSGSGRLWRFVHCEYERLGRVVSPALIAPAQRPAACVLACALPYAAGPDPDWRALAAFAARLPEPLLLGALIHVEERFKARPDPRVMAALETPLDRRDAVKRFVCVLEEAASADVR